MSIQERVCDCNMGRGRVIAAKVGRFAHGGRRLWYKCAMVKDKLRGVCRGVTLSRDGISRSVGDDQGIANVRSSVSPEKVRGPFDAAIIKKEGPVIGQEGTSTRRESTRIKSNLLRLDIHSNGNSVGGYCCSVNKIDIVEGIFLRVVLR